MVRAVFRSIRSVMYMHVNVNVLSQSACKQAATTGGCDDVMQHGLGRGEQNQHQTVGSAAHTERKGKPGQRTCGPRIRASLVRLLRFT